MRSVRHLALPMLMAVVISACGGGTAVTTTTASTTPTTEPTTTVTSEAVTTTLAPAITGTAQDVVGQMVEDPLFGTGFHAMEWEGNFAWSTASIDGSPGELNRLAVGDITPAPALVGIPGSALLLNVWIQNYDGDIIPNGVALFVPTVGQWEARWPITSELLFGYLETTTDYQADPVDGPVQVQFTITSYDALAGPTFRAFVNVFDYFGGSELAFEAEVECTFVGEALDCTLLSDDGVLRPGDEGEQVEALQEDLIALGYFAGDVDGIYATSTSDAVRALQQDYRLARDGKVGPVTRQMIDDLIGGSDIVMASPAGVGDVLFGTGDAAAYSELIGIFGPPDSTDDWAVGACDGNDWFRAYWGGFTAIFTDRDGSRQFDGWHVSDITDVPTWLYFKHGIGPATDWTYLQSIGAGWEPFYGGVWYQNTIGYNNGRFFPPVTDPPAGTARVKSFGTGTGAFVDC